MSELNNRRYILHLDMDAFFVNCELLRHPELKNLPLVVGGGQTITPEDNIVPQRTVVSTASYEARKYGIGSAQPLSKALSLCPDLYVLPVDISYYQQFSQQIFDILTDYSVIIEKTSIDECYLDITALYKFKKNLHEIAASIQERIEKELGLSASIGISTHKTIAKIASDYRKPHGITIVVKDIHGFLNPMNVSKIPGIGPKTTQILNQHHIYLIKDLANANQEFLFSILGNMGPLLQQKALGADTSTLTPTTIRKSVSSEGTYDEDIQDLNFALTKLLPLSDDVGQHLRKNQHLAGTIAIKVKWHDLTITTRQIKLDNPTNADLKIRQVSQDLLKQHWQNDKKIRLLGVRADHLIPCQENTGSIDYTLDRLKNKYGHNIIRRGNNQ